MKAALKKNKTNSYDSRETVGKRTCEMNPAQLVSGGFNFADYLTIHKVEKQETADC